MITPDYQLPPRMDAKMRAIPFPDLEGKSVLDVGCDMGFWCRFALANGAARVVGLDRGRMVRSCGFVDLSAYCRETIDNDRATFHKIDIGKQWMEYGSFDVVFLFSLYHHIYQSAGGDHEPIWYWLSRHVRPGGVVLWENPTGIDDGVVQMNVSKDLHERYNIIEISAAASRYFEVEYVGPAKHEATRSVFKFARHIYGMEVRNGTPQHGAGGATAAFNYAEGRRIKEIQNALGMTPFPGSLNLKMDRPFAWERGYYRAEILDVKNRGAGLDSEWQPRWARFYPVTLYGGCAYAFRFEGEKYPLEFVELIADRRLRDNLPETVRLYR